ncbi:EscV/YscV/HrcV family type III secretion system export apparatus protein [Salmonella enterica]|nr:EscV/YscV/HrcV family type III secretion system export apparatus protein [Salmonella enterica]
MASLFISNIHKRPELIVLAIMILVIIMLVIPLPTFLIDFLIGLNLTIALLIFLSSFYIVKILEFSTFPSILLISTVFRLAISISTSRLILMNADAGEIISSFGAFVISGNLIVGFVVFSIVTIVQFIVITKGSERIAEVAARFSLDAMPGKQMSIDADLRSGLIDENEVRTQRAKLAAESQLYGALDGAMKFIKGDAIAGIIIIFVNLLGGICVGVIQHGMDISEALSVYTTLTIGEALVSQIPALLISISGGFIVTRIDNEEDKNLGSKIIQDVLLNNSSILVITAILVLALGFLPGFPLPVFVLLSAILFVFLSKEKFNFWNRQIKNKETITLNKESGQYLKNDLADGENIPETIPLIIRAHKGDEDTISEMNLSVLLKNKFFVEYGVHLPEVVLTFSEHVEQNTLTILINEIQAASYILLTGMSKILIRGEELQLIDSSVKCVEVAGVKDKSYWLPDSYCERAQKLGFYTRSYVDEFYNCVSTLLTHNVTEFFGIQETKMLLDNIESKYPDLLKECYRNNTVQRITEVFQRLLQERISIRNLKLIIDTLVQWAPKEKDPIMLVEHIRAGLSRYISNRFSSNGKLRVFVLSQDIESVIRNGIRQTSNGSFINLVPPEVENIIGLLDLCIQRNGVNVRDIVLMVSLDLRRFVKKIIEGYYPDMEVLSFSEIDNNVSVDIVDTVDN